MTSADAAHPNPSLQRRLESLYALRGGPGPGGAIDLTIRRPYLDLLRALGNPHRALPPAIHIAGTNGKGSTLAFLRAMLEAAGYRVHAYTSPHLLRFNERIVLAGREIADDALESLLEETVTRNAGGALTFFELTTAAAFAAFARTDADILLLETGLGGRLDCTNVIERPLAAVITPIGFDHMDFLGPTLDRIAAEKAGIMKPGVPCVVARQDAPEALTVLETVARAAGCPLFRYGTEWSIAPREDGFSFSSGPYSRIMTRPRLHGLHQAYNAGTALACLYIIEKEGFSVDAAARNKGLSTARWPGRLQRIDLKTNLLPPLPPDWEIWVDGAHNEQAARMLSEQVTLWRQADGKPLHLIAGLKEGKDAAAFLAPLLPAAASVTLTPAGLEKSCDTKEMAKTARQAGAKNVRETTDLTLALRRFCGSPPSDTGRILITGSLYLAAEALRLMTGQIDASI